MTPDVLSLTLALRPNAPAPDTLPAYLGRAAHAILLDAVRQSDTPLAEQLHDGSSLRPFTASTLIGYSPRRGLAPERTYTLRFTSVAVPVTHALLTATQPGGVLAIGAELLLDTLRFRIEAVDVGNQSSEARNYKSAWAASATYESLSAPWLLGRATPAPSVRLQFISPTTFKSGGRHVPVPLPELVFGSLLEKWNAFAPVALPPETRRFAEECLALSWYKLSTRMIPIKEGGLRAGAVGEVRFAATNRDRYWLSVMHLLADFALFAGVGAGTTMGLGQARQLPDERRGLPRTIASDAGNGPG